MTVLNAIVELTRASWRVLRKHPVLAAFPVLSLLAVVGVVLLIAPVVIGPGSADDEVPWFALVVIGLFAELVQTFFLVALTAEALRAFRGETPSILAGLGTASARVASIVVYAAVTSTVGLGLALVGRSSHRAVRVARALVGTAWSLATYLAVPVIAKERRGGLASLRRSGELFKQTWGETTLSEVGMRVLTVHLSLLLLILAFVLVRMIGDSPLALLVVIALVLSFVALVGSLEAIYRAALYVFAAEGVVPDPFAGPELDEIWRTR